MKDRDKLKISSSLVLLLFAAAWLIRVVGMQGYHPIGGGFFINGFYGIVYTIQNGHMFQTYGLGIDSIFASGVYTSSGDLGRSVTNSMIYLIIADPNSPTEVAMILRGFPWVGVFVFPAAMLVSIEMIPGSRTPWERGITLIASLFGTYQVIYLSNNGGANAPFAWSMILIILYAITRIQQGDKRYKTLLYLPAASVITYYHTASVIVLILVSVFLISRIYFDNVSGIEAFSVFYTCVFIWYFLNYSTTYFISYILKLEGLIKLFLPFSAVGGTSPTAISYVHEAPVELPTYYRLVSISSRAIIAVLFAILFIFLMRGFYKNRSLQPHQQQLLVYIFTIPVIGVFILQAHGIFTSISRMFEYGFISFGILTITVHRDHIPARLPNSYFRMLVTILIIGGAIMSSFVYIDSPSRGMALIQDNEYNSARFAVEHTEGEIWTDYRLSSPLVAQGHYEISGIWPRDRETTNQQFEQVYYTPNTQTALKEIDRISGNDLKYLLLSENMMHPKQGINANGIRFQNLSHREYNKFSHAPRVCKIQDSGEGEVYMTTC